MFSTVWWSSHFFKWTKRHILIPGVTACIQVDSELLLKLFHKVCSAPLPQWFCQGQDCRLSKKSLLGNSPVYPDSYVKSISSIFDELQKHMFTKKLCRNCGIWIAIAIYVHSVIPVLLEHFPLPSLSCAPTLRNEVILLVIW